MSILHTPSAAFNSEGHGEAERAVQKVKAAISHAGDNLKSITSCVANLNYDQFAEIAGHVSSRAQGVDYESQYIMLEYFSPSLARFNSIDATIDR